MIPPGQVTACIPTRGDADLDPILATLPYGRVIVWGPDDDERAGVWGPAGRYAAMAEAKTQWVYTQDDDCVFRHHGELLAAADPRRLVAVYGHGATPDGYDDMALVHGGAIVRRVLPLGALSRYLRDWPADEGYMREADMIVGTLTPHRHLHLPYEIRMEIAQRPNRMCNQPWQRDLKRVITDRARLLRDQEAAA